MRDQRNIIGLLCLSLCVTFGVCADESVSQDAPAQPNDLLKITIIDLPGPQILVAFKKRVDSKGCITMPLVGQIEVKGKSFHEIEKAVNKAYSDGQFLRDAEAKVTREEDAKDASVKSGPIAKGDHLEFRIWDLKGPEVETAEVLQVDEKGEVALPMVGVLKAAGKSEAEAEKDAQKIYHDNKLINNAILSIRRISADEAEALSKK